MCSWPRLLCYELTIYIALNGCFGTVYHVKRQSAPWYDSHAFHDPSGGTRCAQPEISLTTAAPTIVGPTWPIRERCSKED